MNVNENEQTSESQCKRIYAYMMDGHRITSLEALRLFGCMRLASRISDLRQKHPETDIRVETIQVSTKKKGRTILHKTTITKAFNL